MLNYVSVTTHRHIKLVSVRTHIMKWWKKRGWSSY